MSGLRESVNGAAVVGFAIFVASMMVVGVLPSADAQGRQTIQYKLFVDCPDVLEGATATTNSNGLTCPLRAMDEDDMMGSPSIAIDPSDSKNMILASLHGGDASGPSDRSRNAQPFTTFVTTDGGMAWQDNPYFAPQSLGNAMGEHPQVTIDKHGTVYIGSMYSTVDSGTASGYSYTIVAQKFDSIYQVNTRQGGRGEWGAQFLEPYYDGNVIPEFWFVYDNKTDIMTMVWNEKKPKAEEQPAGAADVLGALADDQRPQVGGSRIGMAWTTPRLNEPYHYVADEYLVGPCRETSNAVLANDHIYVACLVDTDEGGYAWDEGATEGQIDLFRFEIKTGKPTYMGQTPVSHGNPRLAVREDGKLAVIAAGVGADGHAAIEVSFGRADPLKNFMGWTERYSVGKDVMPAKRGLAYAEVRIQDALIREDSGILYFIVKTQTQNQGLVLSDPESFLAARYVKHVVAMHEQQGILRTINLDIGNPANRTGFPTKINLFETDQEAVFNDLTDDLVIFPPGSGLPPGWEDQIPAAHQETYQRMFFAVGDYGTIQFAELIEITPEVAGALPVIAGILPVASPAMSIAFMATVIPGTALAGLLALKLALNRRKIESVSITKGG